MVIKIPCTPEGYRLPVSCRWGHRWNVTLVFQLLRPCSLLRQVLPCLPSWEDSTQWEDGLSLIKDISETWKNQGITGCKIPQLRYDLYIMSKCVQTGAHAATIPYGIFTKLIEHELTNTGLEKFLGIGKL